MSITILSNKAFAGFIAADGQMYFAIFMETFRKDDEHAPGNWLCYALGSFEQILHTVFRLAICCEEGQLQTDRSEISPGQFVDDCLAAMKQPWQLPEQAIDFRVGDFGKEIAYSQLPSAIEILRKASREDLVTELNCGRIGLNLYKDITLIAQLCVHDGVCSPKQVIWGPSIRTAIKRQQHLAWTPPPPKKTCRIPPVSVHALFGSDQYLMRIGNDNWIRAGNSRQAAGIYLMDVLYPHQIANPGSTSEVFASFRELLSVAEPLPGDTMISLNKNGNTQDTYASDIARTIYTAMLPVSHKDASSGIIHFLYSQVAMSPVNRLLRYLEQDQIAWEVANGTNYRPIPAAGRRKPTITQNMLF